MERKLWTMEARMKTCLKKKILMNWLMSCQLAWEGLHCFFNGKIRRILMFCYWVISIRYNCPNIADVFHRSLTLYINMYRLTYLITKYIIKRYSEPNNRVISDNNEFRWMITTLTRPSLKLRSPVPWTWEQDKTYLYYKWSYSKLRSELELKLYITVYKMCILIVTTWQPCHLSCMQTHMTTEWYLMYI